MIDKLLITCLQRGKRLIIPDLGAFLKKNVEGVGVTLVFVPFLSKDDGVLLAAVQKWAGVDENDAREIVTQYVLHIKTALDTRGQYIIEGLGVLKYDANGVVYLTKGGASAATVKAPVQEQATPVTREAEAATVPPIAEASVKEDTGEMNDPAEELPVESGEDTDEPVLEPASEEAEAVIVAPAAPTPVSAPEPSALAAQPEKPAEVPTEKVVERVVERVIERVKEPELPLKETAASTPAAATVAAASEVRTPANRDVGTRYFTPETSREPEVTKEEANEPAAVGTQADNRKNTINNLYGGNHSRGTLYGSTALPKREEPAKTPLGENFSPSKPTMADKLAASAADTTTVADSASAYNRNTAGRPAGYAPGTVRGTSPYARPVKKKAKGDLFLIIAIAVAVLAIVVMLYGYFFGGETVLEIRDDVQNEQLLTAPDADNLPTDPEIFPDEG